MKRLQYVTDRLKRGHEPFINNTDLDEKEAKEIHSKLRELVIKGEGYVRELRENAVDNLRIYKNEIWNDQDLALFDSLDAAPHRIPYSRVYSNNLSTRQRNRRINFEFTPIDQHAAEQHRRGRREYVEKYGNRFPSIQEAESYYDEHADDRFGIALSAVVHNARNESSAKYVESELFETGLVTGAHFLKSIYGKTFNPQGGLMVESRGVDQMIWDRSDKSYELNQIDFIGEVHQMHIQDMINHWPYLEEQLEQIYGDRTNISRSGYGQSAEQWTDNFAFNKPTSTHVPVAEMWYKDNEKRFVVYDNEHDEERLIAYDVESEQDIRAGLMKRVLIDIIQHYERHNTMPDYVENPNLFDQPNESIQEAVSRIVERRFTVGETWKSCFWKAVLSETGLFELRRSPLPHGSHPYTGYFPQFANGFPTGLFDDIKDVAVALCKAVVFRELMMAHGSKGLVLVNEEAMKSSGYSRDEIAEAYTQIGGMLFLKLKRGMTLDNAMLQFSTVGDGIAELTHIINDYKMTLREISGVTLAMIGETQGETPTSRYQLQLNEGEANNGIMFDNFYRTLELHYAKKVSPLAIELMRKKKHMVIRMLGDEHRPWVEIEHGHDFGIYDEYTSTGLISCTIRPVRDTPTMDEARSAKMMELAMARPDEVPLDFALKYSTFPNRADMVRDLRKYRSERQQEQLRNSLNLQQIQELVLSDPDITPEIAERIIKQASLQAMHQFEGQQMQQETQPPDPKQIMGMQEVSEEAAQLQRQQQIEEAI